MSPLGFEPTISGDERPQTYALELAATGAGIFLGTTPTFKKEEVQTLYLPTQ